MHYVALQRDQPERMPAAAHYLDARVQIARDDRAPQQVVHDALIALVKPDKLTQHA